MAHLIDSDFIEAANYILEKRLSKPFTDKSDRTDWVNVHLVLSSRDGKKRS